MAKNNPLTKELPFSSRQLTTVVLLILSLVSLPFMMMTGPMPPIILALCSALLFFEGAPSRSTTNKNAVKNSQNNSGFGLKILIGCILTIAIGFFVYIMIGFAIASTAQS